MEGRRPQQAGQLLLAEIIVKEALAREHNAAPGTKMFL
jgi:hypothetical protein